MNILKVCSFLIITVKVSEKIGINIKGFAGFMIDVEKLGKKCFVLSITNHAL